MIWIVIPSKCIIIHVNWIIIPSNCIIIHQNSINISGNIWLFSLQSLFIRTNMDYSFEVASLCWWKLSTFIDFHVNSLNIVIFWWEWSYDHNGVECYHYSFEIASIFNAIIDCSLKSFIIRLRCIMILWNLSLFFQNHHHSLNYFNIR